MNVLGNWLDNSELILNFKNGSAEALLFGPDQRLAKVNEGFSTAYGVKLINVTAAYKYLGLEIDASHKI